MQKHNDFISSVEHKRRFFPYCDNGVQNNMLDPTDFHFMNKMYRDVFQNIFFCKNDGIIFIFG